MVMAFGQRGGRGHERGRLAGPSPRVMNRGAVEQESGTLDDPAAAHDWSAVVTGARDAGAAELGEPRVLVDAVGNRGTTVSGFLRARLRELYPPGRPSRA